MSRFLAYATLALLAVTPAAAQGAVTATVNGNTVSATIALPGNLGADVTLTFEDATGLSLASLGLSATLVDPTDPALLARLPDASLAAGFPVLLRVEPPAAGGLSFRGVYHLEVHTHNLDYVPGTPLRLFTSHEGGPFRDITVSMGSGSYRVRGTEGGFSDFLIVADARPVNQAIAAKFDHLEQMLDGYAGTMPASVYGDLEDRLEAARARFDQGATMAAIQKVESFIDLVREHSGTDIPDVWRAARDVDNAAGYLRAGAATLRFSLDLKRAFGL